MIKILLSLLMMGSSIFHVKASGVDESSRIEQRAQKFTMVYICGTQTEVKRDLAALYGNYVIPAHNAAIESLNMQKDIVSSGPKERGVWGYLGVLAEQQKVAEKQNAFAKEILAAQSNITDESQGTIQFMLDNTAYAVIWETDPKREKHDLKLLLNNEDYPVIADAYEMKTFLENKGYPLISDEDVSDALELYQAASTIFIHHMKVL